jgi:hypothetical protein
MTAVFRKMGNKLTIGAKEDFDYLDKMPPRNYILKVDERIGFYFETISSYEIKGKLYGNTTRYAGRILNTFFDRENSTGVMMTGEKGSGKTLLARKVAIDGAELGMPTIVINTPFHGDEFNALIESIKQPAIILFDEFEKVYDEDQQKAVLTLLDGVFPTKKLFLITCNDPYKLSEYMRNRPGRAFYMLEFGGLGEEFIREFCEDKLNDKSHINRIVQIASLFHSFNFDILKSMVEEMNRYDESPDQVLEVLNAKPMSNHNEDYEMELFIDGVKRKLYDGYETWSGNPLRQCIVNVMYDTFDKNKKPSRAHNEVTALNEIEGESKDGEDEYEYAVFVQTDIKSFKDGMFTLANAAGERLILKKKRAGQFDWRAL